GFEDDLAHFVTKVKAGAHGAITQYFFNPDAYFSFVERARAKGVTVPIIPGIMPITNSAQLLRFSNMCGAEVPRWIRLRLADFGAPGLHMYSLNGADASMAIVPNLNWR